MTRDLQGISLGLFLVLILSHGCANKADVQQVKPIQTKEEIEPEELDKIIEAEEAVNDESEDDDSAPIEEDIEENDSNDQEPAATQAQINEGSDDDEGAVHLASHPLVKKWINFFTGKGRERFKRYMARGLVYRDRIEKILVDNGVPKDLYYLALVESGFVNRARSRAGAVGLWQFIRGTGRRYGLRINSSIDERQDPIRATVSASLYLRDLRNVFNHWYLAMGAYNAGEMRIMRAIMKANTRDFWQLVAEKRLPRETMNYVPKIIAAKIIGENLTKYGFADIDPARAPLSRSWESMLVPAGVALRSIAKESGVSISDLKNNNPHLRSGRVPRGRKSYRIWVSRHQKGKIAAKIESLAKLTQIEQRRQPVKKLIKSTKRVNKSGVHRVRRGDTLGKIARKYKVSSWQLKKTNRLRSNRIYVGQRLRIPNGGMTVAKKVKVRRGDTLAIIARRHGVSLSSLKQVNGIRGSRIYRGQLLKIPAKAVKNFRKYRVRRGDNLHEIARRFGISVASLKRLNRLTKNTIYTGQLLKVGYHKG